MGYPSYKGLELTQAQNSASPTPAATDVKCR